MIVVDVDPEVQVVRLVQGRGFDETDTRLVSRSRRPREQRLATATHVVDDGTLDDLVPQVDRLYAALTGLPQLPADWEMPVPKPKDEAKDEPKDEPTDEAKGESAAG